MEHIASASINVWQLVLGRLTLIVFHQFIKFLLIVVGVLTSRMVHGVGDLVFLVAFGMLGTLAMVVWLQERKR